MIKMPMLIEGKEVELEKPDESSPKVRSSSIPSIEERVKVDPVIKAYQSFQSVYGHLEQDEQLKALEKTLQEGKSLYPLLDEGQKNKLGCLTTLYALFTHAPTEEGRTCLTDLSFLEKQGLQEFQSLLYGLTDADIKVLDSPARYILTKAERINIDEVVNAGEGCLGYSKQAKIKQIKACGNYFGQYSEQMEVGTIDLARESFASNSSDLSVQRVIQGSYSFAQQGKKITIGVVDSAESCFAGGVQEGSIREVQKAGYDFGQSSLNLEVDKIGEAEGSCGRGSKNLRIREIGKTGDDFGAESVGLRLGTVEESGVRFGKGSKKMKVTKIGATGDFFAHASEEMHIKEIGQAGNEFGSKSKDLEVARLGAVEKLHFFADSSNAAIGEIKDEEFKKGFNRPAATGYVVRFADGELRSDLKMEQVLARLKDAFKMELYAETFKILK